MPIESIERRKVTVEKTRHWCASTVGSAFPARYRIKRYARAVVSSCPVLSYARLCNPILSYPVLSYAILSYIIPSVIHCSRYP
jgi:hypothetical protein